MQAKDMNQALSYLLLSTGLPTVHSLPLHLPPVDLSSSCIPLRLSQLSLYLLLFLPSFLYATSTLPQRLRSIYNTSHHPSTPNSPKQTPPHPALPAIMGINWNEQADARLLVGVLSTTHQKLDYRALAEFMGKNCTVSAVQHRIKRLKEKIKTPPSDSGSASASAPPTPTASPAKRGRGRPKKNVAVAVEVEEPRAKKMKAEDENFNGVKDEEDFKPVKYEEDA